MQPSWQLAPTIRSTVVAPYLLTVIGALSAVPACSDESEPATHPAPDAATNPVARSGRDSIAMAGGDSPTPAIEGRDGGVATADGSTPAGGPPSYDGDWRGYTDEDFVQSVSFKVVAGEVVQFASSRDYEPADLSGCEVALTSQSPVAIEAPRLRAAC